jgi:hypothetical protein
MLSAFARSLETMGLLRYPIDRSLMGPAWQGLEDPVDDLQAKAVKCPPGRLSVFKRDSAAVACPRGAAKAAGTGSVIWFGGTAIETC